MSSAECQFNFSTALKTLYETDFLKGFKCYSEFLRDSQLNY